MKPPTICFVHACWYGAHRFGMCPTHLSYRRNNNGLAFLNLLARFKTARHNTVMSPHYCRVAACDEIASSNLHQLCARHHGRFTGWKRKNPEQVARAAGTDPLFAFWRQYEENPKPPRKQAVREYYVGFHYCRVPTCSARVAFSKMLCSNHLWEYWASQRVRYYRSGDQSKAQISYSKTHWLRVTRSFGRGDHVDALDMRSFQVVQPMRTHEGVKLLVNDGDPSAILNCLPAYSHALPVEDVQLMGAAYFVERSHEFGPLALMVEMLKQALADFLGRPGLQQNDAKYWLLGPDQDRIWSFGWVCTNLGIDLEYFQRQLSQVTEQLPKRRLAHEPVIGMRVRHKVRLPRKKNRRPSSSVSSATT